MRTDILSKKEYARKELNDPLWPRISDKNILNKSHLLPTEWLVRLLSYFIKQLY